MDTSNWQGWTGPLGKLGDPLGELFRTQIRLNEHFIDAPELLGDGTQKLLWLHRQP